MAVKLSKNMIEKTKPSDKVQTLFDADVEGLYIEVKPTGKRVWKVRVLKGEARDKKTSLGHFPDVSVEDARELAADWLSQFDVSMSRRKNLTQKDFGNTSFDALIEEHIRDLIIYHEIDPSDPVGEWKPSTVVQKRNTLRKLAKDLKSIHGINEDDPLPVKLLTHEQLKIWHEENEAYYAANRTIDYLSVLLKPYVKKGLLQANPCADIKPHREFERDLSLSRDDLNVLLNELENVTNKVAGAALITIARTGQRPREIYELMREDGENNNYVDFENREFVFRDTKTSKTANVKAFRVGIPPKVLEILRSQPRLPGNYYVFPGHGISHVSYGELRNALDEAKTKAVSSGKIKDVKTVNKMTPYVLRHTFATLAAIAGWSVADIAVQLKHKNVSTTMKYIKKANEYTARLSMKADDLI